MNKLRILIADDERPARAFLTSALSSMDNVEVVAEAENGSDAVEKIIELKPDLALLDLQMPELSGIDVIRALKKNQTPLVAFVTAFDQYAVQAFELNAIDYLLKPVENSRLRETIQRAAERLEQSDWREVETERLRSAAAVYDESRSSGFIERIPVKRKDEIYLVPVAEVASIVADGELLHITTADNQRFLINYRLKDLEARLDPRMFVRLSRGAIANLGMIDRIAPLPGGTYLIHMSNGQELSSSRLQSKILRTELLKL
ncbi:MAG: response regulator transcription factor [Acidobacteria bacterium]|nr:response regulator transcription factor [Acidobacteriota bacterium]